MAKLLRQISSNKCFGGYQKVFEHDSEVLKCKMNFAVYVPKAAEDGKVPVLYFLSGLTCTEQNFITKSGMQQYAAKNNIMIVAPDTSPRGCNIEGEDESWDFGTGAGFYVDATEEKWKKNYQMYSYCTKELPELINTNFPAYEDKQSVFGHSMGGHGALVCSLKNPGKYRSVSCFAPICNPSSCPWGQKAFTGYLGTSKESWKEYDATYLIKSYSGPPLEILIDQGEQDQFYLDGQLLPENLVAACDSNKTELKLRMHKGYDHSYYFISTFLEDHIKFHARFLNA